jgi:hypothetical protein
MTSSNEKIGEGRGLNLEEGLLLLERGAGPGVPLLQVQPHVRTVRRQAVQQPQLTQLPLLLLLVHVPLLGSRTVQWYDSKRSCRSHSCSCTHSALRLEDSRRQGLALSFQMESTQYFDGEDYTRYITVVVSKKDFWARKQNIILCYGTLQYQYSIFDDI